MQQINLYTDAFRPLKIRLPLPHMLFAAGGLLVLLVAVSVWMSGHQQEQARSFAELEQRLNTIVQEVDGNQAKVAMMKQDESLVRNNKRLAEQVASRQALIEMLDSVAIRDTGGYSPFLIGLARHSQSDLWLTHIQIASGGDYLRLDGQTRTAQAVPAYLQRLSKEATFVGKNFAAFYVDGESSSRQTLSFTLESKSLAARQEVLLAEAPLPAARQRIQEASNER